MKFKPLRVLKEYGGTRITLGRDFESGTYLIEKSVTTQDDFIGQLIQNEMTILGSLQHRHIVKYFGEGRTPFSFLMEYVSLGRLNDYMNQTRSQDTTRNFLLQILDALNYLHERGLVHNDIHVSNVLVSSENRCKLSDFAMAGKIGTPAFPQRPAAFRLGTHGYAVSQNIREHALENDFYALGKLIYELVSRRPADESIDLGELPAPYPVIITRCLAMSYGSTREISAQLAESPEI